MDRRQAGRRVELISTNDPDSTNGPGLKGTILFADDAGTIHVKWDNGSTLGLIPGEDVWRELPRGAR